MTTRVNTPLSHSMGEREFRALSAVLHAIEPAFDEPVFLANALDGLEHLTLMERVRRASGAIDVGSRGLRGGYDAVLALLTQAAPLLGKGFVSLVLPDYVGQYGRHAFECSMDALKYFTPFGSSEFAVREFLRDDTHRGLAIMDTRSTDSDDAMRRLASEGSRPRLPWSFRLAEIEADPSLAAPILDRLSADPSAYVRKSVANHLNGRHISLSHTQHIRDFTTRTHYAGRHVVELIVNGDVVANSFFRLI